MTLTYHQYLFSCLADCVDEEWKHQEYDTRFLILPTRYSWFEQSKFDNEDKTEYDCIVDYLHARESLRKLIKSHDFTYPYSNDHNMWKRGNEQAKEINKAKAMFVADDFKELWNKYAPNTFKL